MKWLFEKMFKAVPRHKFSTGFVEIGEWDLSGDEYTYEMSVELLVGLDGCVYAKIAESVDELPDL